MAAKYKLTAAHALSALLVAGLLGGVSASFTVFGIALVALPVAAFHASDVRR